MGMVINTNISALNTYNALSANSNALTKSLEKLSSGYKINSASDDAAGLAISEKMRSQIRGLDQASENAQNGTSLLQTADGALSDTEDILQRMRELAVQASSETNTDSDRTAIQDEIDQLTTQINTIASTTTFNTKNLLNGTMGVNATTDSTDALGIGSVSINSADIASGTYSVTLTSAATITATANTNSLGLADDGTDFTMDATTAISGLNLGDYTLTATSAGVDGSGVALYDLELTDADGNVVASASATNTAATAMTGTAADGTAVTFTLDASKITSAGSMNFTLGADLADAGALKVTNATTGVSVYSSAADTSLTSDTLNANGFTMTMDVDTLLSAANTTSAVTVRNNAATLQIGANEGETMKISVGDMSALALGVDSLDLTTTDGASSALSSIDDAISTVSKQRSALGAYQNRLDYTVSSLTTASENLTSAESLIRDTDMASEMAEYTKLNVLTQAATSMLAQANSQPQNVLSLLQ
ncbi:hypothetical protein P22_2363 [Propionispora sp. 2/2-37]|uniref:flagellin N-terminal helical domain-containing protein n=1 Tax=Propionispora sp. 2/2-37 TaxID=1677858 RepID=UPI0006BB7580|nr:flagellin [Propionispora sp. 2/2-37]CUH96273.1 hypothetical protein P22_2363 [Propionispora sp. 2/2-37]